MQGVLRAGYLAWRRRRLPPKPTSAYGPVHVAPPSFLTLLKPCCYGSNRMLRKSRRYLLLLLAVLAVGYFLYRFRDSITLQGFRWGMVVASIREARIWLLVFSLAAIYVCYALRALRWMRFCRWLGPTRLLGCVQCDARGIYVHVSSRPGSASQLARC